MLIPAFAARPNHELTFDLPAPVDWSLGGIGDVKHYRPAMTACRLQRFCRKDEDGVIDIGWCEGVLSDGRAFRAEMWAQDQISMLTLFFSTAGLETLEPDAMKRFVEKECLVTFKKNGPTRSGEKHAKRSPSRKTASLSMASSSPPSACGMR